MKYRIATWAGVGFLIAGCWALYAFATVPNTNAWIQSVGDLVNVTCPVMLVGRHFPLSLYSVLIANAATYALVGLMAETLRGTKSHTAI